MLAAPLTNGPTSSKTSSMTRNSGSHQSEICAVTTGRLVSNTNTNNLFHGRPPPIEYSNELILAHLMP